MLPLSIGRRRGSGNVQQGRENVGANHRHITCRPWPDMVRPAHHDHFVQDITGDNRIGNDTELPEVPPRIRSIGSTHSAGRRGHMVVSLVIRANSDRCCLEWGGL